MLHAIRKRMQEEQGFTLIELLVVILIIGILAAIAIPSFLSQKDKANDAAAKSYVRNMQTAEETYFTDNNAYAPNTAALVTIEPALAEYPDGVAADVAATPNANGFVVSAKSKGSSGVTYTITKDITKQPPVARSCDKASTGGCNANKTW
jgi:type IV pilus assembly protein PilA